MPGFEPLAHVPGITFFIVTVKVPPFVADAVKLTDHLYGLVISKPEHAIATAEQVRGCFDTLVTATAVKALAGIIDEGLEDFFRGYFPEGA